MMALNLQPTGNRVWRLATTIATPLTYAINVLLYGAIGLIIGGAFGYGYHLLMRAIKCP